MSVYHVYLVTEENPSVVDGGIEVHTLIHTTEDKAEAIHKAEKLGTYVIEAPERRARAYRRRK